MCNVYVCLHIHGVCMCWVNIGCVSCVILSSIIPSDKQNLTTTSDTISTIVCVLCVCVYVCVLM